MTRAEWDERAAAIRAKWSQLADDRSDSRYWTNRGQSGSNLDYALDRELLSLGPRPPAENEWPT